jgi:hypothetical protein
VPLAAHTCLRSRRGLAKPADRRTIEVEAEGSVARTYEPFHRGGLNLMRVRTGDGRRGTAIYEITGARHHHFFPDTVVQGALPG